MLLLQHCGVIRHVWNCIQANVILHFKFLRNFRVTDAHCKHVLNYFFVVCSKNHISQPVHDHDSEKIPLSLPSLRRLKKSGFFANIWGSNVFQLSLVELGAFSFLTVKEFKFMFGLRLVNIIYITACFQRSLWLFWILTGHGRNQRKTDWQRKGIEFLAYGRMWQGMGSFSIFSQQDVLCSLSLSFLLFFKFLSCFSLIFFLFPCPFAGLCMGVCLWWNRAWFTMLIWGYPDLGLLMNQKLGHNKEDIYIFFFSWVKTSALIPSLQVNGVCDN